MSLPAFERFLPGSPALAQFAAIVRSYVGFELKWDLQLILAKPQVPAARLGVATRLGWTSWLVSASRTRDADDVVLTSQD